ncbi:MAG TPA: ATP-binding protein [Bryobacteraceae bacterium]|nr:ATP-binding protein [Bryobacteraceae bacterium]HOQ43692.1 ATP-binding protein [Bryobacteraceae bacterium]HPQ16059.1 ATP-binding protein [Bryobacteraceae bacterium]HPU72446.1 ATP-binding protein [Bryobacteraceae bacterium]
MNRDSWEPALRWIAIAAAVAFAGLADWLAGGSLALLYSIPVVLAALLEGRLAGLSAAAVCGIGLFLLPRAHGGAGTAAELLALAFLAWLVDSLTARERRLRRHHQQIAEQLSSVYEKVQANFEGMKRAERLSAIGQLSAGLAHEIRNPLASISGAAAILSRSRDLSPKDAKCLDIIMSESQRLNGLLTNFLNFARPRPPRLQTVELEPVLDNVLGLAAHGVRGKTVRFEKKIDPNLEPVECDPEQLEQVLLNLMINAIEASPEGETVTLSAETGDGKISIGVIDRGHGVAPGHIDRLFDPFFTTKEHGTGLGLPVAHQIVRQMGGSLVARPNDGQGMTFAVVLPAKEKKSR